MDINLNIEMINKIRKIKEKKNKKRKTNDPELKKERVQNLKNYWSKEENRKSQSKLSKALWELGVFTKEQIYHKDYYIKIFKLTDLDTGEIIELNGGKAFYTYLGYASSGGPNKQPNYPDLVFNIDRTKKYKVEIIKKKGDKKI